MSRELSLRKRIVFSLLITAMAAALVLVVLELGIARYYSQEASENLMRFDPVRGWSLIPGDYWVKAAHRFSGFDLKIDQRGLRSHSLPPKAAHGRKLLAIGDSFTFARETATNNLFTQRLQSAFDAQGHDVEVINAGVPGYGTAQELLLLRELRERHQLNPDVVLLILFTNDILDNLCVSYGNLTRQRIRPCFVVDDAGGVVLASAPEKVFDPEDETLVSAPGSGFQLRSVAVARSLAEGWLQTQPGLVRFLNRVGVDASVGRMPALLNGWYREDILRRGVPLTKALLEEVAREVGAAGGGLIVSMVPSPLQVYLQTYLGLLRGSFPGDPAVEAFAKDPLRPQTIVREMCQQAGIAFYDLSPVFREHIDRTLFIPRDGHLTDDGHRLVADALSHLLRREPRLSTPIQ